MFNILNAINDLANNPITGLLNNYKRSNNRMNSMGDALEIFIQDLFAGTLTVASLDNRNTKVSQTFSYLGNQNNPPDMSIRGGDAIEVKKVQSAHSTIALNSSYPKKYLYSDDSRITPACKQCESWQKKDIIYCIGYVSPQAVKHLWFVYGDCYAADRSVYQKIAEAISSEITAIPDIDFAETNELGRVNKVDPLGITSLRIRGMWQIDTPTNLFNYIYTPPSDKFGFACLMRQQKFTSFPQQDQDTISSNPRLKMENRRIKSPDNPAQLLDVKLITYTSK